MEWNPAPVEAKIGIQFKNSDILRLALSHPSYSEQLGEGTENNERLEFLGNAVINFAIASYLYSHTPYLEVTNFAALRDKLTEGERLTKLWYQLGLGEAYPFLVNMPERFILRQKFPNPFDTGFKALVGAIHLDRGFSQTRNWLNKKLISPVLERYLKPIKERSNPNKQLQFLGDHLLKVVVLEYLYRHLPNVRVARLGELYRELTGRERQTEYFKQVDLAALNLGEEKIYVKSFKALVAGIYLQHQAAGDKGALKKTENWFVEEFVDGDEVLRIAIALLLEDGKAQKWIIRHVMGYESKDYHEGRERFNQLMEGKKS
ncbi:MAG TPA: ribonuclease III [Cyanobacteria bacterium UBA11149]|nr:ribonuclease III [Cyanobacteria bacterium UBA11367]HBE60377.1 ribonuclease III [Cyanobacteria bacterium UBA11366]HBK65928.1 ribonuclease III [Cyanobacteria bacterium UBA11166]HBR73239.1 ribonuclease III [Cyanobacteria bacterium UBA11159]HBS71724.1 ribonuclease III [Cyanobacteria bacterium UBA11153]HBW87339.1 ribonuclease III [Cyanobacteria bacterium UBA11149]HCA96232.1 ribonuclease III [Cyanobacteria bacterium UBA9226]